MAKNYYISYAERQWRIKRRGGTPFRLAERVLSRIRKLSVSIPRHGHSYDFPSVMVTSLDADGKLSVAAYETTSADVIVG